MGVVLPSFEAASPAPMALDPNAGVTDEGGAPNENALALLLLVAAGGAAKENPLDEEVAGLPNKPALLVMVEESLDLPNELPAPEDEALKRLPVGAAVGFSNERLVFPSFSVAKPVQSDTFVDPPNADVDVDSLGLAEPNPAKPANRPVGFSAVSGDCVLSEVVDGVPDPNPPNPANRPVGLSAASGDFAMLDVVEEGNVALDGFGGANA